MESHFLHSFASFQVRGYPVATLRMSWKKDSAAVGLAGLTPVEAAKGALLCEEFQNMPDPLDVKKEDLFLLVCIVYNVDTVETRVYAVQCIMTKSIVVACRSGQT